MNDVVAHFDEATGPPSVLAGDLDSVIAMVNAIALQDDVDASIHIDTGRTVLPVWIGGIGVRVNP